MSFIDEVRRLSNSFAERLDHLDTEEATKHALVLPFIQVLGYAIYDPTEVVPEFIADVGTKKGEKVDYALLQDGKPAILIECKTYGTNLNENVLSQLQRYFLTTDARFGILTDGIQYRLFSNLDADNKMDAEPFFEVNMLELSASQVETLERFSKAKFSLDETVNAARELKYTTKIRRAIAEEFDSPSDEFVRFFLKRVEGGQATQARREQFGRFVMRAFTEFVREQAPSSIGIPPEQTPPASNTPPKKEPNTASSELLATPLSGWQSLATLKPVAVNGKSPKPVEIRFPDNSNRPIKSWSHAVVEVSG